jgi:hypothetical protein
MVAGVSNVIGLSGAGMIMQLVVILVRAHRWCRG